MVLKRKINKSDVINTLLRIIYYVAFTIMMIMTIKSKVNYHVDELYSYGRANNHGNYMNIESGITYTAENSLYTEYLTVASEDRFKLLETWKGQGDGVHPPIYYILLHFICSLMPVTFSKWQAAFINIVFALLSLFIFRRWMLLMTESNTKTGIATVGFIFIAGTLRNVSFLRMYVIAMFAVLLFTYCLYICFASEYKSKNCIALCLSGLLCALTDYCCIVWMLLICFGMGIYMLIKHKTKEFITFLITMIVAGTLSVLMFPSMIFQLFGGEKSSAVAEGILESSFTNVIGNIITQIKSLDANIFGGYGKWLILFAIFWIIYCISEKKKIININADIFAEVFVILVLASATIYIICFSFAWNYERYVYPLYGVLYIVLFLIVDKLAEKINHKYSLIWWCAITALLIFGSNGIDTHPYLYSDTNQLLLLSEKYSHIPDIYLYETSRKAIGSFAEMNNYQSITFVRKEEMESFFDNNAIDGDEILVTISGNTFGVIDEIQERFPQLDTVESFGGHGYAKTFYLHNSDIKYYGEFE